MPQDIRTVMMGPDHEPLIARSSNMPEGSALYLHEELLLLALHDDKGTLNHGWFGYGMGGAALAELILAERVKIERVKKTMLLTMVRSTSIGEPYLDECLELVAKAKRRASVASWVGRFGSIKRMKDRVADRLCLRGILRKEEGRTLRVFSRSLYPTVNPEPERELLQRLRPAIFDDGAVAARTAILATLAYQTGVLNTTFDKKELKQRKARLEALGNSDAVGAAAREAISAAQAAMIAVAVAVS